VSHETETLRLADEVAAVLASHGAKTAVIGAIALAIHGYARGTEDLDLATAIDLAVLRKAASDLEARGCVVRLGEPDADDPLGGVLTVSRAEADPVQVVNYANPFRPGSGALAASALASALPNLLGSLAVVDLPHLVALKLYAGGRKSTVDVLEILDRNPDADRGKIRDVCARFGLEAEWNDVADPRAQF
jgi:hypothetical protein